MALISLKGAFDETSAKRYALVAKTALGPLFDSMMADLEKSAGPSFSPQTVLDLGSGPGVLTRRIAERFPGAKVTGVEPSRAMLEMAASRTGGNVTFLEGSAEKIPLPDASADLVVSHNSVKHWNDRAAGLGEIMRVLRPGGYLWLCEIDRDAGWSDSVRFLKPTGKPFMVVPFKLFVSGGGLKLKELARLVKDLPLSECHVAQVRDLPMIRVLGRRS